VKALGKTIIIAFVFAASMTALMEIKGQTLLGKRLHRMIFLESIEDWRKCILVNCRLNEIEAEIGFLSLAEPCEIVTPIMDAGFPFTQLILSWNSSRPDSSSALEFLIEVSKDSARWHRFDYQLWGPGEFYEHDYEPRKTISGVGQMNIDFLALETPMRFARVIVRAHGAASSKEIYLRRLALSFSAANADREAYEQIHGRPAKLDFVDVKLAVPYFTQRNLPKDLSGNCCSPTSVSMVLNYHGVEIQTETLAREVYDKRDDLYGNWPHNVAAAYANGMSKTWVEVHCSFDEIYQEVADGRPVVISISYNYDELPNTPIHEAPDGHLVAVVGFVGPDTVICNDPAGHYAEDGIVKYPRKELEDIWLRHGSVAYHLWPGL